MKLLTEELSARLPPLYSQEAETDPMVYAKFFMRGTGWTWYVTEGSQQEEDFLFFGFVVGLESEFGYFWSLSSKVFATSWTSGWNAIWHSAKAGSPMSYPPLIYEGRAAHSR